ncbi:MAG: hypothetical protein NTX96_00020 [Candidatus Zambryskibacteria bacterium]|nr:hypothetical protein [Candidatus Zambryskibacteria bacterium]
MKNKDTFYIVLVVLIICGVVWYLFNLNKTVSQPTGQYQNNQEISEPTPPKFIAGSVLRVEGQKIFIKVGAEEKTIITDEETVITKQTKEEEGFKDISANLNEIKSPSQITVSYSENSGVEYKAIRIRILNF